MAAREQGQDDLRRETAGYIARLSRELRQLAHDAGLGMVAYLLDMVMEEAARHTPTPAAANEDDTTPAEPRSLAS